MGQQSIKRQLYITIQAGETQSQQLFDFHSKDNRVIITQIINHHSFIVQEGTDISYKHHQIQPTNMLYSINWNTRQIELESGQQNDKIIWKILSEEQNAQLQVNSVVKIGKIKLKLKKIVVQQEVMTRKSTKSKLIYRNQPQQLRSLSNVGSNINQNECRMCFQSTNTTENPLISLCKCSGSVKYTHYDCLRQWINNNVVKRQQNNILFFSYQETKCEICKEYFYPEFTIKGMTYELLNFEKAPVPPYAIFEEIDEEDEKNRYSVFLIGLGQDEITIGRNSSSTIIMKEISVSRNHCSIVYKNNQLFIRDKGSKFGTLIKIQNEVEFSPKNGLNLQLQSKVIKIFQKNSLKCCCDDLQTIKLKLIKKNQRKLFKTQGIQWSQKASQML